MTILIGQVCSWEVEMREVCVARAVLWLGCVSSLLRFLCSELGPSAVALRGSGTLKGRSLVEAPPLAPRLSPASCLLCNLFLHKLPLFCHLSSTRSLEWSQAEASTVTLHLQNRSSS